MFSIGPLASLGDDQYFDEFTTAGDLTYFLEKSPSYGDDFVHAVWRTNGTADGTFRVRPAPGEPDFLPSGDAPIVTAGRRAFFKAITRTGPTESFICAIDPSTGLASALPARNRGQSYEGTVWGAALGDLLYYDGGWNDNENDNDGIWISDGTAAGTRRLGAGRDREGANPFLFTAVNGTIYYAANHKTGYALFATDGTVEGTRPVLDGVQPTRIFDVGGRLMFTDTAERLWTTDGTGGGFQVLEGVVPGAPPTRVHHAAVAGARLYFSAFDETHGYEWWTSDGTQAGTYMLRDIRPGPLSSLSILPEYAVVGGFLYFLAWDGQSEFREERLWRTDGTTKGTVPALPDFQRVRQLTAFGDRVAFVGGPTDPGDDGIYVTGGSVRGASLLVGDKKLGQYYELPDLAVANSRLLFTAYDSPTDKQLWQYGEGFGEASGFLFDDRNGDGRRDSNDRGRAGFRVFIDRDRDGHLDKNKERWVRTTGTGRWRFDGLGPATYLVAIATPQGWRATTSTSFHITVHADGRTTRNFGMTRKVLITGTVFMDADRDGRIDPGEGGMGGWTVFADADNDGVLDDGETFDITDANGRYRIGSLAAGTHHIRVVQIDGYRRTIPGAGRRTVSVSPGEIVGGRNFGEKRLPRRA